MPCKIWNELNGEIAAPVGAEGVGVDHAVVADVGFVQALEARLVCGPRELAGVDDGAAQAGAVAAQVFGQRLHHDVRAVLDPAQQVRRRYGVVHDQRQAVAVGHLGQRGDVGDVAQRVADRFREDGLGAVIDLRFKSGQIAGVPPYSVLDETMLSPASAIVRMA
ncbi:hypothetical protein G6F50_016067 [Rhizopus delemar]|uniref:Uncharacterized protein n=1 Tax=Rhizopus delemar TaxID=936053 RepID=A0A9P7C200_9FUNG|nr:hypothetical protein G6F50_016067 [Rhizopus delemar]